MEKRKKTHVDYVLEREIRHAYDVLDDLKFIRQLYIEDRQEQAYGFSLGTVKVAEKLALNVRHLAVSLNAPCAEKDVPRMVNQTFKVEIGFTEHEYFCMRIPLLIPGKDIYSLRYLKNNLSAVLLRFYEHRPRLKSKHSIVVFRHVYDWKRDPWERTVPADAEVDCVIKLLFQHVFREVYAVDFRHYHCCAMGENERTEVYVVPLSEFGHWFIQESMIPEKGWKLYDSILDARKAEEKK